MASFAESENRPGRILLPYWIDLAPLVEGVDGHGLDHASARLWALVLASRHIPCRMRSRPQAQGGGYTVQVQSWFADRAIHEITLHREENRPGSGSVVLPDLRPVGGRAVTVATMTMLILFYWAYTRVYPAFGLYPERWLQLGSVRAASVLFGDIHRVFTGLTLHGNGAHVLGNAVIGGVFIWLVSRRLGSGMAWLCAVLGGGVGGWLNSLVMGPPHDSIGFSTASFCAAGMLAGIAPFHGTGLTGIDGSTAAIWRFARSALVPVGAGLGLLAMLGAGEDTDLGAHLFGFISGLVIGPVAGILVARFGAPGVRLNACCYALALALPVTAWWVAFN